MVRRASDFATVEVAATVRLAGDGAVRDPETFRRFAESAREGEVVEEAGLRLVLTERVEVIEDGGVVALLHPLEDLEVVRIRLGRVDVFRVGRLVLAQVAQLVEGVR